MKEECPRCEGTGLWTPDYVPTTMDDHDAEQYAETGEITCPRCDGSGTEEAEEV